ncbi:MAG: LemA family protein, partial [Lachnospiraceae bacterium]|nr:LemA family protein [Lachnospiraceae bacterium]
MKKGVIAIIVAVVVLLLFFVGQYNSLVSEQTAVEEHAANIDTQLQRRADLIPNLVKTVKSFAEHETAVFS